MARTTHGLATALGALLAGGWVRRLNWQGALWYDPDIERIWYCWPSGARHLWQATPEDLTASDYVRAYA